MMTADDPEYPKNEYNCIINTITIHYFIQNFPNIIRKPINQHTTNDGYHTDQHFIKPYFSDVAKYPRKLPVNKSCLSKTPNSM